jgi:hypothetical protein
MGILFASSFVWLVQPAAQQNRVGRMMGFDAMTVQAASEDTVALGRSR